MSTTSRNENPGALSTAAATTLWIALVAALSVGGSYVFTCAAPLAAVAALAATRMDRASGLTLVVAAWIANQAVGYGLLDYPQTAESVAWGCAIGLATVAGFFAARRVPDGGSKLAQVAGAFLAAFVVYELALYAAGLVIGGSEGVFSAEIVGEILTINVVAFVGLLVLHRVGVAAALLRPSPFPDHASA